MSSQATGDDAAHTALLAVWEQHRPGVLERVDALERILAGLRDARYGETARKMAQREAHKLAGSVGTFGFLEASERAREVELVLSSDVPLTGKPGDDLVYSTGAIRAELKGEEIPPMPEREPPPGSTPDAPSTLEDPADATASAASEHRATLLAVDDDVDLLERLAAEGASRGLRVRTATNPTAARAVVAEERPAVVLLDLGFPEGSDDALGLLSELSFGEAPVPVLVFTASDAFTDRVEVARRGARGYLRKTMRPGEVISAVVQTLDALRAAGVKVVAVDDDPTILDTLHAILGQEDIALTRVPDPRRLWGTLDDVAPDLLILDIDMPRVSGIELCRAVRNDPRWRSLPVVFLTARRDPETVQEVFAAGGDDYLTKPIVRSELTTRIRNRLERIRLFRTLAETDPLTGVANRRASEEKLEQLLRLAHRYGQPVSLVELDVDHFKDVNDRFGHAAGDAVLRHLGGLLRRHFRGEDVVARWGGEEFVVGMYGMTRADGVHRVAEVLEAFRGEDFGKDGVVGSLTFTAGVAEYMADGSDLRSLYHAADDALYRAKAAGRDRVVPAGWSGPEPEAGVDVVVVEGDAAAVAPLLLGLQTRGYRARWLRTVEEGASLLAGPKAQLAPEVVLLGAGAAELDGLAERAATIPVSRDADVVELLHEVRRALAARAA
ncbi:MAG: diguanylate cyclase [Solirubrobacteraceae bacterium]